MEQHKGKAPEKPKEGTHEEPKKGMAEEAADRKIFRKKSLERIASPDGLNDYIHVTGLGIWLLLAAILLLLSGILLWSVLGAIPVEVSSAGHAENGTVVCYVTPEEAQLLSEGMQADVKAEKTVEGRITGLAETPLSYREAAAQWDGDYAVAALEIGEWNVKVTIECDDPAAGYCTVTIKTDEIRPISFLLN